MHQVIISVTTSIRGFPVKDPRVFHDALDDVIQNDHDHDSGCEGCWSDETEPYMVYVATVMAAGKNVGPGYVVNMPVPDGVAYDNTTNREAHELLDDILGHYNDAVRLEA